MDDAGLPSITRADAPFNDASDFADLVIRTADSVDFFVHKVLLSLESPSSFFRHVLESSHHTGEKDGLPVLEVKEDSRTFRTVLLLCYPYDVPKIKTIEECFAVGVVLDKYCLDNGFERFIRAMFASPLMKQIPLRIFGFTTTYG